MIMLQWSDFIKPNLMQLHSSYVVTDPKGTVLIEVGKLLSRGTPKLDKDGKPVRGKNGKTVYEPYKIKVFNTINFSKSMHYNRVLVKHFCNTLFEKFTTCSVLQMVSSSCCTNAV